MVMKDFETEDDRLSFGLGDEEEADEDADGLSFGLGDEEEADEDANS
jgi:hypothetical protein